LVKLGKDSTVKKAKGERLVSLLSYFFERYEPVSLEKIYQDIYREQYFDSDDKAFKKVFDRDKKELADAGVKIETVQVGSNIKYTLSREDFCLPNLELTTEERACLVTALKFFLDTSFGSTCRTALAKLSLGSNDGVYESVPVFGCVDSPDTDESLAVNSILESIVTLSNIRFFYQSKEGEKPVERVVSPYRLFKRDGSYYVWGLCHLRDEIRRFKVDRITSKVKILDNSEYEIPDDVDLHTDTGLDWLRTKEPEDTIAKVRLAPHQSIAFLNNYANVESTRLLKDGSLDVIYRIKEPMIEEFVGWVLKFGPDAKVVSPDDLIDMIKRKLLPQGFGNNE
jgi:predicted DNA-binding transcriptional regulator YafY